MTLDPLCAAAAVLGIGAFTLGVQSWLRARRMLAVARAQRAAIDVQVAELEALIAQRRA